MNKLVKTLLGITFVASLIFGGYLLSNHSIVKVFAETFAFNLQSGQHTYYGHVNNGHYATGVSYDYGRFENITGSGDSAYMNSLRIDNADSNRSACYGNFSVVDSTGYTDKRYYSLYMEVIDGEEYVSLGGYRADNDNLYTRLDVYATKSCVTDRAAGFNTYDMFGYQ